MCAQPPPQVGEESKCEPNLPTCGEESKCEPNLSQVGEESNGMDPRFRGDDGRRKHGG